MAKTLPAHEQKEEPKIEHLESFYFFPFWVVLKVSFWTAFGLGDCGG
jgi:hypothetical protein